MTDHPCIGVYCDICDELACPDRMQTIDGLDICAVCAWRLADAPLEAWQEAA